MAEVHRDYFEVGAQCATTASYQASVEGFSARGIDGQTALDLIARSVLLAEAAREAALDANPDGPPLFVAGSVGPYGAYRADGSEYRGDYDLTRDEFIAFHRPRATALAEAGADVLAVETLPKLTEALAVATLADELGIPAWYSFSLRDARHLSDGTPLADVARAFEGRPSVVAIGVNCVPADLVTPALEELAGHTWLPLIVYPNSGESYDPVAKRWAGGGASASLADLAPQWRERGAKLIGGCCRTTPADIAALAAALRSGSGRSAAGLNSGHGTAGRPGS
ncbi:MULTISPECIES: homocysteine S-methyltransferase [Microbacterium]|uniref:homocysteine S-methyltransferase n=1 Tax=Microbacterium TaxID=33882 RepID=UPI00300E5402